MAKENLTRTFPLRLTATQWERLERESEARRLSMSWILRDALERELSQWEDATEK